MKRTEAHSNGEKPSQGGLRDILNQSLKMLELANTGEWEVLAELMADRERKLQLLFTQGLSSAESAENVQLLKQLIAINSQITNLCEQAREESRLHLQGVSRAREAIRAYDLARR